MLNQKLTYLFDQLCAAIQTESMLILTDIDRRVEERHQTHWTLQIPLHLLVPCWQILASCCFSHLVENRQKSLEDTNPEQLQHKKEISHHFTVTPNALVQVDENLVL